MAEKWMCPACRTVVGFVVADTEVSHRGCSGPYTVSVKEGWEKNSGIWQWTQRISHAPSVTTIQRVEHVKIGPFAKVAKQGDSKTISQGERFNEIIECHGRRDRQLILGTGSNRDPSGYSRFAEVYGMSYYEGWISKGKEDPTHFGEIADHFEKAGPGAVFEMFTIRPTGEDKPLIDHMHFRLHNMFAFLKEDADAEARLRGDRRIVANALAINEFARKYHKDLVGSPSVGWTHAEMFGLYADLPDLRRKCTIYSADGRKSYPAQVFLPQIAHFIDARVDTLKKFEEYLWDIEDKNSPNKIEEIRSKLDTKLWALGLVDWDWDKSRDATASLARVRTVMNFRTTETFPLYLKSPKGEDGSVETHVSIYLKERTLVLQIGQVPQGVATGGKYNLGTIQGYTQVWNMATKAYTNPNDRDNTQLGADYAPELFLLCAALSDGKGGNTNNRLEFHLDGTFADNSGQIDYPGLKKMLWYGKWKKDGNDINSLLWVLRRHEAAQMLGNKFSYHLGGRQIRPSWLNARGDYQPDADDKIAVGLPP